MRRQSSPTAQPQVQKIRTNFARSVGITVHEHSHTTIWCHWGPRATKQVPGERLARFQSLHGQQLSHRFWDAVTLIARVNAFLGNHLDLGASTAWGLVSFKLPPKVAVSGDLPVLEPNLNRPLRHVDLLGNALSDGGSGGGVFIKFDLEG